MGHPEKLRGGGEEDFVEAGALFFVGDEDVVEAGALHQLLGFFG